MVYTNFIIFSLASDTLKTALDLDIVPALTRIQYISDVMVLHVVGVWYHTNYCSIMLLIVLCVRNRNSGYLHPLNAYELLTTVMSLNVRLIKAGGLILLKENIVTSANKVEAVMFSLFICQPGYHSICKQDISQL